MAMLGVGRPEVYVTERGGGPIIGELTDITRLLWDRRRDDISECIVEMRALSPKCCEVVNRVQAVRHELVVHRDGRRVWEGPITLLKFEKDSILIEARDVLWYADRFTLPKYDCTYDKDKRPRGCNVLELADRMLTTTYKDRVYTSGGKTYPLPKYNVEHTVYIKDGGLIKTEPEQEKDPRTAIKIPKNSRTCFDVLDGFATGSGIDYTVLGRHVLVWDHNFMPRQLPQMVQSHFQGPINLGEYGQQLVVRKFRSDNNNKWVKAEAPAKYIQYYGFIDSAGSDTDLDGDDDDDEREDTPTPDGDDTSEKDAQRREDLIASTKRALQYPVPRHIQIPENTVLDPCLPVAINQLVPGSYAEVRFEHACRQVSEFQLLNKLTVEYVDGGEQVRVNMGPAPQNLYRRKPGT